MTRAWVLVISLAIAASCGHDDTPQGPAADAAIDASAAIDSASETSTDAGTVFDATHDSSGPDASSLDSGPPELPPCPTFTDPVQVGTVAASDLTEASGVVASRALPDVLWLHNDSGDDARLFALAHDGAHLGTLSLSVPRPRDAEDIAIAAAADGGWFLYLGDIGDNDAVRASISIVRVREPGELPPERPFALTLDADILGVTYPDGAHNAETLLADPATGDLFIVEKTSAAVSGIYRIAAPFVPGGSVVAERVATLSTGDGLGLATGGDVSPDGREVAVRGYGRTASLWRRLPGSALADAFATEACAIPIAREGQGEAFGWLPDGSGYVTTSEGAGQPLHRSARR